MGPEVPDDTFEELDLTPSPRLLEVLGEIPYKPWQCLAELVDNSFDDFLSNPDRPPGGRPSVQITVPAARTDDQDALVCVADNGRGMSVNRLEKALKAGYSGHAWYGNLGLFGLGFNIATARLGHVTEVRTTRAADADWLVATIDFGAMRESDSFRVPLRHEPKDDNMLHGTEVTVRNLRPDLRGALKRPNAPSDIRRQLGGVYSYLLRSTEPVPEFPDESLAGQGFDLYINKKKVSPRLPCVWSGERTVTVRGGDIKAVQTIDRELSPAVACLTCGHWHKADVDRCVECGGDDLELRERRVRGWLGIQRYLSSSEFGIDFLRNGRKIATLDKSPFTWENRDTGESFVEYPIELPANQGRIVGEIHLDHVRVNYQKTDFDRSTPEWINAEILFRGEGPLQPRKARDRGFPENTSPLASLHKGFRRNDPGLECLIPGDGKHPTHEASREWGQKFHSGLAEYLSDDLWYEAAHTHDEIKSGEKWPGTGAGDGEVGGTDIGGRTGLDDDGPWDGGETTGGPDNGDDVRPTDGETEEQRFARYRSMGRQLFDLHREVSVAHLAKRPIAVWVTKESLNDDAGRPVPCLTRSVKGGSIEVYVHGDHEIFREYGRDPRDYALIEVADVLRTIAATDRRITRVLADVTRQFPDQRIADAALRERAGELLRRVRDLMAPVVAQQPAEMWVLVPNASRRAAQREAASADPTLDWPLAMADGGFAAHLDANGVAALVREEPGLFLDGIAFSHAWAGWIDESARDRQVGRITRLLETVGEFVADTSGRSPMELAMARLTLDMLDDALARRE